jgi:hypothetical protein
MMGRQPSEELSRSRTPHLSTYINDVLILNEEAKRKAFRDAGYDKLLSEALVAVILVREI